MKEELRRQKIQSRLAALIPSPARAPLSTGFRALDEALAGGLPRAAIVELFGPASCGKTTLALQIVAHVQSSGGSVAWIDAEHAFDPARAAFLGVELESLPVIQPQTAEQALESAERLAATGALDLLVLDSAAALVPDLELRAGLGESGGLQSRVLAWGLRRLSFTIRKNDTCICFLNQTRGRGGDSGEETTAGGAPLKLFAAARIALEAATGGATRFRVLKNRASGAFDGGRIGRGAAGTFVETP